jgi:hypothetical protein
MRDRYLQQIGLAAVVSFVLILSGCGGTQPYPADERGEEAFTDVTVDAYLFDAQLRRDGKPTSVRLEIYQTDTLVGLSGRGYLGKGALQGRLTDDSLLVYFPSTNEYFYEPVESLLSAKGCANEIPELPLASLLITLPDSLDPNPFTVQSDYSDIDKPAFSIEAPGCPWRIDVTYNRDDGIFRVSEFEFDNGSDTRLKADRRELKHGVTISSRRFTPSIPPDALRLAP